VIQSLFLHEDSRTCPLWFFYSDCRLPLENFRFSARGGRNFHPTSGKLAETTPKRREIITGKKKFLKKIKNSRVEKLKYQAVN
jgi:hypothetical protein